MHSVTQLARKGATVCLMPGLTHNSRKVLVTQRGPRVLTLSRQR